MGKAGNISSKIKTEPRMYTLSCYSKWNDSFQELKSRGRWYSFNNARWINSRETTHRIMILVSGMVGVKANLDCKLAWIWNPLKHKQLGGYPCEWLFDPMIWNGKTHTKCDKKTWKKETAFCLFFSLCWQVHPLCCCQFLHWC